VIRALWVWEYSTSAPECDAAGEGDKTVACSWLFGEGDKNCGLYLAVR